jgi:hypothetical protein
MHRRTKNGSSSREDNKIQSVTIKCPPGQADMLGGDDKLLSPFFNFFFFRFLLLQFRFLLSSLFGKGGLGVSPRRK